jgi:glycogen synthase
VTAEPAPPGPDPDPGTDGGPRAGVSRVAIAASSFAPHRGGVEELVRQLAREQLGEGGSTTVLTMRWPKSLPAREAIEGVPVRRYLYRAPEGGLAHRALAILTMPVTIGAVALHLRLSRAQLVHVQCVSSAAWFVARAARLTRLPLVVTLQGELTMDATDVYGRSPFLRSTLRQLLRTADAVTACSQDTLDEARTWSGLDLGDRATVVPNGVRLTDFEGVEPTRRPRPYVLAIGRHVRQKGFDVLLDAYAELCGRADFDWDLVIAGDGPEHDALVARAEELGLADRVAFPGATDRRQTIGLFKGSSLFALPSRHEPFGIVNLEAMAAGRPVVASSVGGVPEFIEDGVTGLLVPPEDPGALAEAIGRLHDDPRQASALGQNGLRRANDFDWPAINRAYQHVYRQAMQRRASR